MNIAPNPHEIQSAARGYRNLAGDWIDAPIAAYGPEPGALSPLLLDDLFQDLVVIRARTTDPASATLLDTMAISLAASAGIFTTSDLHRFPGWPGVDVVVNADPTDGYDELRWLLGVLPKLNPADLH